MTHTHTCMHARTHARARTHTHTHTQHMHTHNICTHTCIINASTYVYTKHKLCTVAMCKNFLKFKSFIGKIIQFRMIWRKNIVAHFMIYSLYREREVCLFKGELVNLRDKLKNLMQLFHFETFYISITVLRNFNVLCNFNALIYIESQASIPLSMHHCYKVPYLT